MQFQFIVMFVVVLVCRQYGNPERYNLWMSATFPGHWRSCPYSMSEAVSVC